MIDNFAKLEEINIGEIKPEGWLEDFLKTQASGLTGNLEVAGYPFDTISWETPDSGKEKDGLPRWWPYEQTAYWVDAMERCGRIINDKNLISKAEKSIDYVLSHPDSDGYLGPAFMKGSDGDNLRWSHTVFFRALMAKYSATGDVDVLEKMTNHYLKSEYDYSKKRNVDNVENMLWLYLNTGNKALLSLAEKTYKEYNEQCTNDLCDAVTKTSKKPFAHGVSYNEFFKLGAILYICTGKKEYLRVSEKAYNKLDRYFMLADGLHCSDEETYNADHMQGHEACDISDYTWSLGYLLMATGNARWADKIEKCIFNAGIGQVTEDFRALQYFSCPNQVILDRTSNHCKYYRGIYPAMTYRPMPLTQCCPANVSRFFPNYCARMWFKKNDELFAALYGECTVNFNGMSVKEKTNYPFDDTVLFVIETEQSKKAGLNFRVPEWCSDFRITVNGQKTEFSVKNGFAHIERVFNNGDRAELFLPSEIRVGDYRGQGNVVEKGPLVYACGMFGKREIDSEDKNSSAEFPAYNIYPDKDWNYALCTQKGDIEKYRFEKREMNGNPWDIRTVPYSITAPAKKVNGWKLARRKRISYIDAYLNPQKQEGNFAFTPRIPTKEFIKKHGFGEKETVTLVPMAAAKLRITVFPKDE